MTCSNVEQHDLVARYAHGRLTGAERDAFEQHFLGCSSCFDALQTYRVLHSALGSATPKRVARRRPVALWLGLAAAALLAVVIGTTLRSGDQIAAPASQAPPPAAATASPEPAATAPAEPAPLAPAAARAERIALLARFDPPRYEPPALRGADDEARRRFESAMEPYRSGDFTAAATALRSEAQKGAATPNVLFYLAIAELQTRRLAEAIAGLEQVVATNDVLLEEDAHFFLGKALLLQDDVARARQEFARVVTLVGDRQDDARRLVAGIDALPRQ